MQSDSGLLAWVALLLFLNAGRQISLTNHFFIRPLTTFSPIGTAFEKCHETIVSRDIRLSCRGMICKLLLTSKIPGRKAGTQRMRNINKLWIYIIWIMSGYLFITSYIQSEISLLSGIVQLTFILFLITLIKLQIDIFNTEVSRTAHPSSLYPSIFFDEVFSSCEEKDWKIIEKLQNEILALQSRRTPQNSNGNISAISEATRQIEQKYEECLKNYLKNTSNLKMIFQLKNKIELCHKTIEKEKSAFLSNNGETAVSFIFNTQNYFTDIFLTGFSIPILLETLKWEVNGVEDFMLALEEKPIMCIITGFFLITLFYRILKYFKNKRSMLRSMNQTVLYDKVELMLYSFECALKNIDN